MKKWIRTVVLILLPLYLLFVSGTEKVWAEDIPEEEETAVKVIYIPGNSDEEQNFYYRWITGLRVGDLFRYEVEKEYLSGWIVWTTDENDERNILTIDSLSANREDNRILLYGYYTELKPQIANTVYIKDAYTGEQIKESYTWSSTVYDNDLEPFTTEDGSLYEFDSENPGNQLLRHEGDLVVYFRKVLEVSFDGNGGSIEEEPHTVKQGLSYGELPVPVRAGYLFDGWYTQPEGGEEINCDSIVSLGESHTLYARWKKEGEDAGVSNSSDSGDLEKATTPEKVTWKKSIAKKGKRIQLRWKKVKGADGYQLTIAGSRAFKKAKNRNTATNKIILKKKKAAQYVKIRAYKKDATGKKVYGAYSRVKKVKAYQ